MALIVKVIILQAFWFFAVITGPVINDTYIYLTAITIVTLNYLYYKPSVSKGKYIFLLGFFILYGLIEGKLITSSKLASFPGGSYPFWMNSLFVVFLCYFGDLFNKFQNLTPSFLFLIGGGGGVLAYYSGSELGSMIVSSNFFYIFVFLSWGIFFPLAIKLFYKEAFWNKILDMSIIYSFDRSGFLRHKDQFREEYDFSRLSNVLITGGTSGIGLAGATELAKSDVDVLITGRDREKGNKAEKEQENLRFLALDLENWSAFSEFAKNCPCFDGIVLNAGGMPEKFKQNFHGVESQFASQLFGHFYLVQKLREHNKIKPGSMVIWMSSGGMYLKKLDIETIFENSSYNKISTYANVKRAQVELLDYFQTEFKEFRTFGMHPGWVHTPAVETAIPNFFNKMQEKLRQPLEGADTYLWLLGTKNNLEGGAFYFDRKIVPKNPFFFIRTDKKSLIKLMSYLSFYKEK